MKIITFLVLQYIHFRIVFTCEHNIRFASNFINIQNLVNINPPRRKGNHTSPTKIPLAKSEPHSSSFQNS